MDTIDGVRNTFSSWDSCMSKAYCKWPVISAIIVASIIALSIIWCLARCLCCGLQCCCGCCACCNACCPSPRSHEHDNQGYQQAPPTPYGGQYQAPPPMYAPGGMNTGYFGAGMRGGAGSTVATTATFDSPSGKYNEDALPAMPSWDTATKRRVEDEHGDVEMEKLQPTHAQQEVGLLSHAGQDSRYYSSNGQETGDLGAGGMHASPYHDYAGHQQTVQPNPYGTQRSPSADPYGQQGGGYAPSYRSPSGQQGGGHAPSYRSPSAAAAPYGSSADYFSGQRQQSQRGYEPSVAAPSYHTQDAGDPYGSGHQQAFGRKPVQGSWREV